MGSIGGYIFRTTFGAFLVVCASVTALMWITQALRDIGQLGETALPALEALAGHDPSPDVRREAQSAIEKIRSGAAAPMELQRLRDEITKLREEDRKLRERLEKLDAKR